MRRPPLLLALALALLALAGCGSGDEAPEPPPGFARYEDEGFSLAYPRDWKPREKETTRSGAPRTGPSSSTPPKH